jgi:hypothetical protein
MYVKGLICFSFFLSPLRYRLLDSEVRKVSVFLVDDVSHPKRRAVMKANMTKMLLTGCVVVVKDVSGKSGGGGGGGGVALVYVEGSERAMRGFSRLMLERIKWDEDVPILSKRYLEGQEAAAAAATGAAEGELPASDHIKKEEDDDDDDDDDDGDGDKQGDTPLDTNALVTNFYNNNDGNNSNRENKAALVWRGIAKQAAFSDFRFYECENRSKANVLFKTHGLTHLVDILAHLSSYQQQLQPY